MPAVVLITQTPALLVEIPRSGLSQAGSRSDIPAWQQHRVLDAWASLRTPLPPSTPLPILTPDLSTLSLYLLLGEMWALRDESPRIGEFQAWLLLQWRWISILFGSENASFLMKRHTGSTLINGHCPCNSHCWVTLRQHLTPGGSPAQDPTLWMWGVAVSLRQKVI